MPCGSRSDFPLCRGRSGPVFAALPGAARALCCYVPAVRMDDATRLEVFRQSLLSRRLEERVMSLAKAGEVQPLLQAISRHPNIDVRLTTVKLLALSNQQQVLPALRTLAARESLPATVHAAVMEAIYSISTQVREQTSALS